MCFPEGDTSLSVKMIKDELREVEAAIAELTKKRAGLLSSLQFAKDRYEQAIQPQG